MTGVEIAVGYVFAWAVRKGKRVAGRADAEVDRVLDAAMDRLDYLVETKLGPDPALAQTRREAETGQAEPSERTRRRLTDSLAEATETDEAFAAALREAVAAVQQAGGSPSVVSADAGGLAVGGSVSVMAEGGSAAALRMGDVTIGNPPMPGLPQE